jgi:hypothetical protein
LLRTLDGPPATPPPIDVVAEAFRRVTLTSAELIDEQRDTR